jgi:hypothetical protein
MSPARARRQTLGPWLLAASPTVVMSACYAPTQVEMVLTTDLACADRLTTAIYRGASAADVSPVAQTDRCVPGGGVAELGSLVFVPSGDADGRARVKVTVARGRDPTECDAHPEDCVTATRSFSFVEHRGLRLPIQLTAACLGKRCPDGQTCGSAGTCVSSDVTCVTGECTLPDASATVTGEPPAADGGGAGDAAEAAVAGPCAGPNGDGVLVPGLSLSEMPAHTTFDGTYLYYDVPAHTSGPALYRVPVSGAMVGGAPELMKSFGLTQSVVALTSADDRWLNAYLSPSGIADSPTLLTIDSSGGSVTPWATLSTSTSVNDVAAFAVPDRLTAFVARADGVYTVALEPPGSPLLFTQKAGKRIALDGQAVYLATANNVVAVSRANPSEYYKIVDGWPVFAKSGDTVFAAVEGLPARAIYQLHGLAEPIFVAAPTNPVQSLAAESGYVYWSDSEGLWRANVGGGAGSEQVVAANNSKEPIDHIVVTGSCVYYWSNLLVSGARLMVHDKTGAP